MKRLSVLILAGGKGTRLKSNLPKVLHRLAGKPLIEYVVEAASPLKPSAVWVVVGYQADQVRKTLSHLPLQFVVQEPQLGTGHAVQVARQSWEGQAGHLLILSGDVPLISTQTIETLVTEHERSGVSATLLSTVLDKPQGYGRVVRGEDRSVERIVEENDASAKERQIREINTGIYCFAVSELAAVIGKLAAANAQKEYYLTDCIGLLREQKKAVAAIVCEDSREVSGINSRLELSQLEHLVRAKKLDRLMRDGVTIVDPSSTYVETDVEVGADTVLYPNVYLESRSKIGSGCQIYPNVRISGSVVGNEVVIFDSCLITNSEIRSGAQIGPFAHLRGPVVAGRNVRIGNFVEVKNSQIGDRTKAAHLSYLGDAQIGEDVNIGAGTITCNYDGVSKHKTVIENGVFVGSDSQLIAPVTIHRGAYIAAGSTIQQNVPEDALAIARSRQVNKENWARKKRPSRRKE